MEKCHTRNNGCIKYEIPLIVHKGEQFIKHNIHVQYIFECILFFFFFLNKTYARLELTRIPFHIYSFDDCILLYGYVLVMQQPITKDQFGKCATIKGHSYAEAYRYVTTIIYRDAVCLENINVKFNHHRLHYYIFFLI